jgi:protein transport protein SEC61 subunit gamma-like protein
MDQAKEFLEMPREFVKDGRQFITRCSKRTLSSVFPLYQRFWFADMLSFLFATADKREFLRISQAVGMGFLIMGVIGYIVKLSKSLDIFLSCLVPRPSCSEGEGFGEGWVCE